MQCRSREALGSSCDRFAADERLLRIVCVCVCIAPLPALGVASLVSHLALSESQFSKYAACPENPIKIFRANDRPRHVVAPQHPRGRHAAARLRRLKRATHPRLSFCRLVRCWSDGASAAAPSDLKSL